MLCTLPVPPCVIPGDPRTFHLWKGVLCFILTVRIVVVFLNTYSGELSHGQLLRKMFPLLTSLTVEVLVPSAQRKVAVMAGYVAE